MFKHLNDRIHALDYFDKVAVVKNIRLQALKNLFCTIIFLASFTDQGVLSKDPIVWLDGARPANMYLSLLPEECTCTSAWHTHKQSMFASI